MPVRNIMKAAGDVFYSYEGSSDMYPCFDSAKSVSVVVFARFLPIYIDQLAAFIKISKSSKRGSVSPADSPKSPVYYGDNNPSRSRDQEKILRDNSFLLNGVENTYYNSPTLNYINI